MSYVPHKLLEELVVRINKITDSPTYAYTGSGGIPRIPQVGNFHLRVDGGFYSLVRTVNLNGDLRTILEPRPKNQLLTGLKLLLIGIELGKEKARDL